MTEKCELCGVETDLTRHHLVPQLKCKNKYREIKNDDSNIIMICRQCHDHLHATYSESELRDRLNSIEALKSDDKIMKFVNWRMKHADFNGHSKMSNRRKH